MNIYDDWGCGYYRAVLPTLQCYSDLSAEGIHLHADKDLHSEDVDYNSYVLHRLPIETTIFLMQQAQKRGQKFIIELDDDILRIPDHMPSVEYKMPKWGLNQALEMADEVWVATEELKKAIGKPEKTYVLPNLIDTNAFLPPQVRANSPLHILWAGSMWHEKDLEQIVRPVERIVAEYGDCVRFIFWGYMPSGLFDFERIPGQNIAHIVQTRKLGNNVLFLDGLAFRSWYDKLSAISPAIALAPLYDCDFNDSKSNLKYLEMTMAGAVTVATDLPPYQCIEHGKDGLLVEPMNEDQWYHNLKMLIDNPALRQTLWDGARKKVEDYSWQSPKKKLWLDAFRRIA